MNVAILTLLGALSVAPQGQQNGVVVGALEQPQCKDDPAIAVRALFQKRGQEWVALSTEEDSQGVALGKTTWTVAFDGRSLGTITTVDPGFQTDFAWTYSRDRLLHVPPGQTVPRVVDNRAAFYGWCAAPKRRPLVVVSRDSAQDPDGWTPFRPSASFRSSLFASFKEHAGSAVSCPKDPDVGVPFNYVANDLVFSRSYRDRSGTKLIVVGLDGRRRQLCDGPGESAWSWHTFLVGDDTRYLGQDLTLVDAGDYDGDGASELLFWYSGYDEDGYTLVYDGGRKSVDYHWNYH